MTYSLGRVASPPDVRDHPLSMYLAAPVALPPAFKPKRSYAVLNQGQTPKCVAFSGALGRNIDEWADMKHSVAFDPNDLYARCKAIDGDPTGDGTFIRVGCKVLSTDGALVTKASASSGAHPGERLKIAAYAALTTITDIKQAIVTYGSAWIGSDWYNSWFTPNADGTLPSPDTVAGGHAYKFIGYDDSKSAFLMQNSWGSGWSVKGRAWMPYLFVKLDGQTFEGWRTIDVIGDK